MNVENEEKADVSFEKSRVLKKSRKCQRNFTDRKKLNCENEITD